MKLVYVMNGRRRQTNLDINDKPLPIYKRHINPSQLVETKTIHQARGVTLNQTTIPNFRIGMLDRLQNANNCGSCGN